MTTTIKALVKPKYVEAVETRQYPASTDTTTSCKASIDKCTVTNVSATIQQISISIVPVGNTAGVANRLVVTKQIQPGATYSAGSELVGHVLEIGDFISTLTANASTLVLMISGRQFT
jgi:hypothetical protein